MALLVSMQLSSDKTGRFVALGEPGHKLEPITTPDAPVPLKYSKLSLFTDLSVLLAI
jgi:hypothetical protein